jgi:hypothetical protein
MNTTLPSPNDDLVEALAALEHEQWMHWSRATAPKVLTGIQDKWRMSWVNYPELTEELKEADRVWARKVVALLRERKLIE